MGPGSPLVGVARWGRAAARRHARHGHGGELPHPGVGRVLGSRLSGARAGDVGHQPDLRPAALQRGRFNRPPAVRVGRLCAGRDDRRGEPAASLLFGRPVIVHSDGVTEAYFGDLARALMNYLRQGIVAEASRMPSSCSTTRCSSSGCAGTSRSSRPGRSTGTSSADSKRNG